MSASRAGTHSRSPGYLRSQPSGLEDLCVNADVSGPILAAAREELAYCYKKNFDVIFMSNIVLKTLWFRDGAFSE